MNTNFKNFLDSLLSKTKDVSFEIKWKKKKIKWMASYFTLNYWNEGYIKLKFEDKSFLLILPDQEEIYYSDNYRVNTWISDFEIGKVKFIEYNWKKYKLWNKNDYQYVSNLYIGTIKDIEWEVEFSDYFPVDWSKEFLSLWFEKFSWERADINPILIDLNEIKLIIKP